MHFNNKLYLIIKAILSSHCSRNSNWATHILWSACEANILISDLLKGLYSYNSCFYRSFWFVQTMLGSAILVIFSVHIWTSHTMFLFPFWYTLEIYVKYTCPYQGLKNYKFLIEWVYMHVYASIHWRHCVLSAALYSFLTLGSWWLRVVSHW